MRDPEFKEYESYYKKEEKRLQEQLKQEQEEMEQIYNAEVGELLQQKLHPKKNCGGR